MSKTHTKYICQNCAYESARWVGRCPNCAEWNTLVEEIVPSGKLPRRSSPGGASPVALAEVDVAPELRSPVGIAEFDRVLGGGIVAGSVVLIGGDPGIGKSTLMMQVACAIKSGVTLYVTGEESVAQIKLRAERLALTTPESLLVLAETNLEVIQALFDKHPPDLLVVDSIQTMFRPELESAPGTVGQVREATAQFLRMAKTRSVPVFLVGHVTKDGSIAGPKVVEHMVDTVLQFEGERHHAYRILRAVKNRFGSTNEIGVFEMQDGGLREVANPSEVFLSERRAGSSGSAVVASMEGSRPLLLEVQALVAPTSYGVPQRTSTGFDSRRLQMLLAVLERRSGLRLGQYDVFVNVAGGVRVDEPAVDLGMALAIVSSHRDVPVDARAVAIGEIGLGGEIRSVSQAERRVTEAGKLGFSRCVLPRANARSIPRQSGLLEVDTVDQAIEALIPS
ncbi:MAG TPA: DNA repair protein RadA [Bacteroidota bacterium]|nr:DNA repair protein RadA [Bacteroidota bacterium]